MSVPPVPPHATPVHATEPASGPVHVEAHTTVIGDENGPAIAATTVKATPLGQTPTLCELLTWKQPLVTARWFGGIVAALVLLKVNVLLHLFYLGFLALLVTAGAEYAGKIVTGKGLVSHYVGTPPRYAGVLEADVLPEVVKAVDCVEQKAHAIIYAHDVELTAKAAGVLYALYHLTLWFSLYTLALALVIAAFTLPPVYVANKREIDAAANHYYRLARAKAHELYELVHAKAAPHLEAAAKKTGPVGAFLQQKWATRTAGSTVGAPSSVETEVATDPATGVHVAHTKVEAVAEPVQPLATGAAPHTTAAHPTGLGFQPRDPLDTPSNPFAQ